MLYLVVYPFYIYLMGYIYPFNGRTVVLLTYNFDFDVKDIVHP